jgi:hypothetical protein
MCTTSRWASVLLHALNMLVTVASLQLLRQNTVNGRFVTVENQVPVTSLPLLTEDNSDALVKLL